MPKVGFSTGALARGDFRRGLSMQSHAMRGAVELSALREQELDALIEGAEELQLGEIEHVSVHAPSRLAVKSDGDVCRMLERLPDCWPIIVHPDVMASPEPWSRLGSRLCIENMDGRKSTGRTAEELEPWMRALPQSGFCLDVAHAAQIDPSMGEAVRMLERFGSRLLQVHVSRLGPSYEHLPLNDEMKTRIEKIVTLIPEDVALIIESVVDELEIQSEIEKVREVFRR